MDNTLANQLNKTLHNTMRSPKRGSFSDLVEPEKHDKLLKQEIEEFEKANVEDMGIPVTGGASQTQHSAHKFSSQDMDGIILDPIAFHSSENLVDGLHISSDKYEDSLLYISSTGSESSDKKMIDLEDGFDQNSVSSASSSLFNLNSAASNFLESSFNEDETYTTAYPNSFIRASNLGINADNSAVAESVQNMSIDELIVHHSRSLDKSIISFDDKPYEDIETELNNWFVHNELSHLQLYRDSLVKQVEKNLSDYPQHEQHKFIARLVLKLNEYYNAQENFAVSSTLSIQNLVLLSNTNDHVLNKLTHTRKELAIIQQLTYLLFGNFAYCDSNEAQLEQMVHYFQQLVSEDFHLIVIKNVKKFAQVMYLIDPQILDPSSESSEAKKFFDTLKTVNEFWYLNLTSLYFILTVFVFEFVDKPVTSAGPNSDFKQKVLKDLCDTKILVYLVKAVEKWRYNNKILMKIRNILMILNKLVLVEFGSSDDHAKTKDYLKKKYNVKSKREFLKKQEQAKNGDKSRDKAKRSLYAFPLDYYVYSKDLVSRYPSFEPPNPTYPQYLDNNSSLSQFIEVPRTLDTQFVNNSLPVPTIHIATPAPSPSSSPSLAAATNGKGKRSFQTNQSYPFIYPVDETIKDGNVPFAIKEASEIFASSVVESFAKKQLWNERVTFMQQERGWKSSINPTNLSLDNDTDYRQENEEDIDPSKDIYDIDNVEEEISKYPEYAQEIQTLRKVEEYYEEMLPTLGSLVEVFVHTLKSNNNVFEDALLKERKKNMESQDDSKAKPMGAGEIKFLKQKLEIIKTKEVTLKSVSCFMCMILKWFKISHVLKAENLGTMIYDSGFIDVLLNYLKNESFADKLFNEEIDVSDYNFFAKCSALRLGSPKIEKDSYYFYNNLLYSDPKLNSEYYKEMQIQKLEQQFDNSGGLRGYINLNNSPRKEDVIPSNAKGRIYDTSGRIFNKRYCLILNDVFKIVQKIILNKTRRGMTLSEKQPVDVIRMIIKPFYNQQIYKSILKILKEIIPYNGKKWKSANMDLVSLIYINLDLKLKDHWLSGRDIENEMSDGEGQELALRALIQFYTARKYEEGMDRFGYERRNSDFFGRETDLIASNELSNDRTE